ncbi:MAG: hypothetical protein A2X32_08880 [Elusimicrobia bacterium GWC2_64_44]|nr:MAG: hypothetical protein A2X32_08880 [Elusimicrobia bacterium GWC2_64_44]
MRAAAEGLELPQPAPRAAEKEWTVLVFINGKNNLEPFGLKDLNEMETAGSTDRVNVVVQLARIAGYSTAEGDWKTVRRYLVKKDSDLSKISSPVLQELPRVDMGDYRSLADFGRWAKERFPARRYMVIVWNHGSGWKRAPAAGKGISYDDETGSHMSVPQLARALAEMGGADVYASDACLMQMAEVVYELKDTAQFIVGSEETEPADGYSYGPFLARLLARPAMPPAELAAAVVDAYNDFYASNDTGSTLSVVNTAALPDLLAAVNAFTSELMLSGEKELIVTSAKEAKRYTYPENKDLYDFTRRVAAATASPGVKAAAQRLNGVIKGPLVVYNRTTNSTGGIWGANPVYHDDSNGLAVYFPHVPAAEGYTGLRWAADSGWDEFLAWLSR